MTDERGHHARRNYHYGHLVQNKNERKTKCSDKKEAVGNDYFWMPFLGNDAERTLQSRQAGSETSADELALIARIRASLSRVGRPSTEKIIPFQQMRYRHHR